MKRAALLTVLSLTGCAGVQSAAEPAGRQAAITGDLFQLFLSITGFFFILVLLFLGWAIIRRDRGGGQEAKLSVTIATWAGTITLGLFVLTLGSYFTDRHLALASDGASPIKLRVTAQQFWWQVEYEDSTPSNNFRTANEIHLPIGRPAHLTLSSDDVIHSFWVPNLAGKQDLIPGRVNDIALFPTRVGRFRGQCAEFCGLQHAHMALEIIVEPPAGFAAWRAKSIAPAHSPTSAAQRAGYAYFMSAPCAACHTISGTPAQGTIGPDLSRVASRTAIAAESFPNRRDYLERWIADPQAMKPGNRMPTIPMSPEQLHAVTAYLESLT